MSETGILKSLPLIDMHEAAGARFGGFAGWSMPITYPAGVMKEHLHTRRNAGLFDISHMKLFAVDGPDAGTALSRASPVEPEQMVVTQSKYTFLLDDSAGIIDDLIVTRLDQNRFMVVANAGNAATGAARLSEAGTGLDVTIEPLDRVFLAIQGPEAADIVKNAGIETDSLFFMHGVEPRKNWFMSRSGYTGEDGFEIALPEAGARDLAARLLADDRAMWIGLAARDSLRLEAGLCLHGQDIDLSTTPVEAGLIWAIPKSLRGGGPYAGADALQKAIAEGASRKRVGLKPEGRQPVRAGAALVDDAGETVGHVTSGGFGPTAGFPVAMGYVAKPLAANGTRIFADVRDNRLPVDVHPLPFTPHRYRKG